MLKMTPKVRQKVALISQIAKQFNFVIHKSQPILLNKKIQTRGFEFFKKYEKVKKIKSGQFIKVVQRGTD